MDNTTEVPKKDKYLAQKLYYQRNKEKLKEKAKEYYDANRENVIKRTGERAKRVYKERKNVYELVKKLEEQGIIFRQIEK